MAVAFDRLSEALAAIPEKHRNDALVEAGHRTLYRYQPRFELASWFVWDDVERIWKPYEW